MQVLVTGGAGYIGSTVAAALVRGGHDVCVLDNLSKGHRAAVPPDAAFVAADLADERAIDALFAERSFDAVIHMAALIEAGESMREPGRFFRNNSFLTLQLLEAMRSHGVQRFVFSSTAALYGVPEATPIREEFPLHPVNAYGESKLFVERMLAWYRQIHGLRFASLRYFNAAGARSIDHGEDHSPESHLIPLVLEVPRGMRDAVKIFGTDYDTPDGTCVRDYVHVLDLASAHVLALEALDGRESMTYNLGSGRGYSVREVIDVSCRVTGADIPAIETERRPGDPAVLVASSDKIREELGWRPEHESLETILSTAWAWHKAHPHGYADRT